MELFWIAAGVVAGYWVRPYIENRVNAVIAWVRKAINTNETV